MQSTSSKSAPSGKKGDGNKGDHAIISGKIKVESKRIVLHACSACFGDEKLELEDIVSEKAVDEWSDEYKTYLTKVYGLKNMNSTVPSFGIVAAHRKIKVGHSKNTPVFSASSGQLMFQELPKRVYENTHIRELRWMSTLAYFWLMMQLLPKIKRVNKKNREEKKKNPKYKNKSVTKPTEIQCAMVADAVLNKTRWYLSENKNSFTKKLRDEGSWRAQALAFTDAAVDELLTEKAVSPLLLARFKRHRDAMKTIKKKFLALDIYYVVPADEGSLPVHAETKIMLWLKSSNTIGAGSTIHVAGIMRPCLCCFVRLLEASAYFRDRKIELIHKPRPGPFWPTQAAFRGITQRGKQLLDEYLQGDGLMYLSLSGNEKKATYGFDTDSDEEEQDIEGSSSSSSEGGMGGADASMEHDEDEGELSDEDEGSEEGSEDGEGSDGSEDSESSSSSSSSSNDGGGSKRKRVAKPKSVKVIQQRDEEILGSGDSEGDSDGEEYSEDEVEKEHQAKKKKAETGDKPSQASGGASSSSK